MNRLPSRLTKSVIGLLAAVLISGCATSGNPQDPIEGFNRTMFHFNDAVDTVVMKPIASAYSDLLPNPVQTAVSNFFGNIRDLWTAVNNLLQGQGEKGMSDVARVLLNSSFGLGGLIDIATEAGIPKHRSDFGITLGVWGVGPGPYVVLPLVGPSTARDTVALPADWYGDAWTYVRPVRTRNAGIGLRAISDRAKLLDTVTLLEDASLDKYEFVRDAFLQRRASLISGTTQNDNDWSDSTEPEAAPIPYVLMDTETRPVENSTVLLNEPVTNVPQTQLNTSLDTQVN